MGLLKKRETIVVCDNLNIFLFHMDTAVATVFCYHSLLNVFVRIINEMEGSEYNGKL